MANYVVEFDDRARRDLAGLAPPVAARVVRRLKELEENPLPRGSTIKRLRGFSIPTFRFRVGNTRAVFRVAGMTVVVLRVVHRSELDRALEDFR